MTKKTRSLIFAFCIAVFILAAPVAVFYSQGYRLDFEARKIVQTGSFYFQVEPGRADIYLNGKLRKTTALWTNSAYIENLSPKKYQVEIKKQGFHSWKKTLEIKEKALTKATEIILFPENPKFRQTSENLPELLISATSSDKEKLLQSDGHEISLQLLKEDKKVFLTRFSEEIGNIFWLNDYYLIFSVGDKIKIAEIDDRDTANIIDLAEFENPEIIWDQASSRLFVVTKEASYISENIIP